MALKILQPGCEPLGQFDGLDTEILTLKGGEAVTFTSIVASPDVDRAAHDSLYDGYVSPNKRVVVTRTLGASVRPLMLSDDGLTGYGTLFGTVIGGNVGQIASGGVALGPHTAAASGKVTCWEKPGLYAVTLDAADTNAATGLTPTNTTLNTGDALYATTQGLLTPVSSGNTTRLVGRFVDFETNGALVTTSNGLLNGLKSYSRAVFYFNPSS